MTNQQVKDNAPKGANRYSISTGMYYKYAFKGIVSKRWTGKYWVNSTVPFDAIRFT